MAGQSPADENLTVEVSFNRRKAKKKVKKPEKSEDPPPPRALDTSVWKKVEAPAVAYPSEDEKSVKSERAPVPPKPRTRGKRRKVIPIKDQAKLVKRESEVRVEKKEESRRPETRVKKEEKIRLAERPPSTGSSSSSSGCDSLSSILGYSLTNSSDSCPDFSAITTSSSSDFSLPKSSTASSGTTISSVYDPYGRNAQCTCAHTSTSHISDALSIDNWMSVDTSSPGTQSLITTISSEEEQDTVSMKPKANRSFISVSSKNDIPSFTELCETSKYETEPVYSPAPSQQLTPISFTAHSKSTVVGGSQEEVKNWCTVTPPPIDGDSEKSKRKRDKSRRRKKRKEKKRRHHQEQSSSESTNDLMTARVAEEETTITYAKAWAVLIIIALIILTVRYYLPTIGKRRRH